MEEDSPHAQSVTGLKPSRPLPPFWMENETQYRRYRKPNKEAQVFFLTDLGFGVTIAIGLAWVLLVCLALCLLIG